MSPSRAIWWIRRDLRVADNPALSHAHKSADEVVPLFILDDALLMSRYASENRAAFLFDGLRALDKELRSRGSKLVVRHGSPGRVLDELVTSEGVELIVAEHDFSPYARRRDDALVNDLPLTLVSQPALAHPDDVLKDDGSPYTVFTPYARKWKSIFTDLPALLDVPGEIATPEIAGADIPSQPALPKNVPFSAGEQAARDRLATFTTGDKAAIYRYEHDRDRLDLDGTARLSPYLRFGMISAREAIHAAMSAVAAASDDESRASAESWLNELIWREFYISILHHFPHVRQLEFKDQFRGLQWLNDKDDIDAWKAAKTGYPIVDACMRQLHSEGWMHNRGRMITASFLIKHLLVDWRIGELHFMQHLLDGDPASNNGGWQWTAGTGTDAAPYFRIFNPITQSQRHDPHGRFIRRWLPELAGVPDEFIHEPWRMSMQEQQFSNCQIGQDYPEPIVDHAFARRRALEAYKKT